MMDSLIDSLLDFSLLAQSIGVYLVILFVLVCLVLLYLALRPAPAGLTLVDPRPAERWARAMLRILGLCLACSALGLTLEAVAFARMPPDAAIFDIVSPLGEGAGDVLLGLDLLIIVAILAAGVQFGCWTWRVVANAHALVPGLRVTPLGAVLWYLLPLVNFWLPFVAIRQAFQVAAAPESWRAQPVPRLIYLWWGLWVAATLVDILANRLDGRAYDASGAMVATALLALVNAVSLPIIWLASRMMRQLSQAQAARLPAAG